MELIYKYNYRSDDLKGAQILIYNNESVNQYTISAYFKSYYRSAIPTIKTKYDVILYEEDSERDDDGMITKKYNIIISAYDNPRPENLFIIE